MKRAPLTTSECAPLPLLPTWLCALLAVSMSGALAQDLPDPTPPPLTPAMAATAAPPTPVLQAILIDRAPGRRRLAVIDGVIVAEGGSLGGKADGKRGGKPGEKLAENAAENAAAHAGSGPGATRVERIGANEVQLRRGATRQLLRLFGNGAAAACSAAAPAAGLTVAPRATAPSAPRTTPPSAPPSLTTNVEPACTN